MDDAAALNDQVKRLLVDNLMLQMTAEEIGDQQRLFGPDSLGLDSVDALQLVVALEKQFGLKIANPDEARTTLQSVETIAAAIRQKRGAAPT